MYYKGKDEQHQETKEHFHLNMSGKFPSWLLLLIVAVILIIGCAFIVMLRKPKTEQKFGFRFY